MKATIEISMYPLHDDFEQRVIDFIQQVKKNKNIEVETNGLSTQLFGDYDELMKMLAAELKASLENNRAVFVMKIAKGELKKEKLPDILR